MKLNIFKLFSSIVIATSCLATQTAHAVVAGGMVSIDRSWPSLPNGYDQLDFIIQVNDDGEKKLIIIGLNNSGF